MLDVSISQKTLEAIHLYNHFDHSVHHLLTYSTHFPKRCDQLICPCNSWTKQSFWQTAYICQEATCTWILVFVLIQAPREARSKTHRGIAVPNGSCVERMVQNRRIAAMSWQQCVAQMWKDCIRKWVKSVESAGLLLMNLTLIAVPVMPGWSLKRKL